MIETFALLLAAHALADFLLQSRWMAANKRNPAVTLLHSLIVLITAQLLLGQFTAPALLVLAALHLVIDLIKARFAPSLRAFLLDQAAHLAVLLALAALVPDLWAGGLWVQLLPFHDLLPGVMTLLAGALLTLRAGDFAIALLMARYPLTETREDSGLEGAGSMIGLLERAMIFVLVLSDNLGGIGFLVAAKSILRFGTVSGDRKATEYVIIGTLFSFGWAICLALGTQMLLAHLPSLEITRPNP